MQLFHGSRMSMAGLVSVIVCLVVGPAFAETHVDFSLELGGDNHAAQWHDTSQPIPCFSWSASDSTGGNNCTTTNSGSGADGQAFPVSSIITWAVKVKAYGSTAAIETSPDCDPCEVRGVANAVFHLALYKDSVAEVNLASTVIWKSTIHDGVGVDRKDPGNPNPQTKAAFTHYYRVGSSGGWPGRVMDNYSGGGPRLEPIYNYPYDPGDGRLIGMGCGYKEWYRSGFDDNRTYSGVGMDLQPGTPPNYIHQVGLGEGPIAEGQMDTTNLAAGTYVLKVMPGTGNDGQTPIAGEVNNVLRGDLNLFEAVNRQVFAISAGQTAGQELSFILGEVPIEITGWQSIRSHGTCGNRPITLSATGSTTETRKGGIQKIEVTFDTAVPTVLGTIQAVGNTSVPATSQTLTDGGYKLVIEWSGGLPDQDCYTIDLTSNINGLVQNDYKDVMVLSLAGDVDGDGGVDLDDALAVNANNGKPVCTDDSSVKYDIDVNGVITLGDTLTVSLGLTGHSGSCP